MVLAGVAIALAARRFSERHNDYVAIMKSLGATSGAVNRLYGRSLLLLGLFATAAGCLLGWSIQALFFGLQIGHLRHQPVVHRLQDVVDLVVVRVGQNRVGADPADDVPVGVVVGGGVGALRIRTSAPAEVAKDL